MRNWKAACAAAIFAAGISTAAHADEWNKLTLLTFSGPVDLPGITLPAGTYRFELADPSTGRRVIRVADKDGTKNYGIFLSVSNQRMEPADKPVVMFQEAAAGAPQAVKVWFYPGETYGYEFVYPHDQALKIARATHGSVLAMKDDSTSSTTEDERVASVKGAEVTRIDENDRPVSRDEELKQSTSPRVPVNTTAQSNTAQSSTAQSNTAQSSTAQSNTAQSNTAQTNTAQTTTTQTNTARSNTSRNNTAQSATADRATRSASPTSSAAQPPANQGATAGRSQADSPQAVGTSGTTGARAGRRSLPRTASELPMLALLSVLSLAGAAGARVWRMSVG